MIISFSKSLVLILLLACLVAGAVFYSAQFEVEIKGLKMQKKFQERFPLAQEEAPKENIEEEILEAVEEIKEIEDQEDSLPSEFLLTVPFAPQSPYAVWDEQDEESCEEASIVIVHYFRQKKALSLEAMRKELDALVDFQIKNYGDYKDSNAKEIARLAQEYYGYEDSEVHYDITVPDLKKEIIKGNPVIIPAAGRRLGNPYFTPPGPLYHNLVLIGYNQKGFITNDPGTRRGENYFYPYQVLYEAIHDFPGSKNLIEQGQKAMIIVK